MSFKVIKEFIDTDKTHYLIGDAYPAEGAKKPTKKRIETLTKTHEKYNCIFIEKVEEEEKKADK